MATLGLWEALTRGDVNAMRLRIQEGADVHTRIGEELGTFLLHAASLGNPACVELLIFHGVDVNARSRYEETPMHHVVNVECIEILLKYGADINVPNVCGVTPLYKAVERKSSECVKMLLENGADPTLRNKYGSSPLDEAILNEDISCMDLLIPKVDINEGGKDKCTALHIAVVKGFVEGVRKLLQSGANVNAKGNATSGHLHKKFCVTALHLSLSHNNESCSRVLIANGADVNITEDNGMSPLHVAALSQNMNLVKLVVGAGANVNAQNNLGQTPLMLSVVNYSLDCVRVLLEARADPNIMSEYSVLGLAAIKGYDQCVDLLLQHGANPNAKQEDEKSILFLAQNRGHLSCVRKLLEYGPLL